MKLLKLSGTDPYFNIAAEEYFLKNTDENLLIIYRDIPSLIVGKHQNTYAEINTDFVTEQQIPVIRRISGGGAVYHDLGNLNHSLLRLTDAKEFPVNFREFTQPVIVFLQSKGIKAEFAGKNSLFVKGKKFSGNSAHVFKNRVMHHGTLLFSTDLEKLEKAIRQTKGIYTDKAVQSVRSNVENLSVHLDKSLKMGDFMTEFSEFLSRFHQINTTKKISAEEKAEIEKLASEKYRLWEWNYAYSPVYNFNKELEIGNQRFSVSFTVKNGRFEQMKLDLGMGEQTERLICSLLLGTEHRSEAVLSVLIQNNSIFESYKIPENKLIKLFF